MPTKPVYDFCFDKFTIGDSIAVTAALMMAKIAPATGIPMLLEIIGRFTNIDPIKLPLSEMLSFTEAFVEAYSEHLSSIGFATTNDAP